MTNKFLELATDKDVADTEEELGRAYAASIGKPWPMPPSGYGPGRQPEPPELGYQKFYARAVPMDKGGGVLEIDATADALSGAQVTLADSTRKTLDVRTSAKLATALSSDAKAARGDVDPIKVKP